MDLLGKLRIPWKMEGSRMFRKKVALYILICSNFTVLGHSTNVQPYERIFSKKTSLEEIKKNITAAIERNDNSVDLKDRSGATLLVCAIETGEPELVRFVVRECHADVNQLGIPQSDTNDDWQVPVLPIEFARTKLELSETQADRAKWKKIIHYLKTAQNSDEIFV